MSTARIGQQVDFTLNENGRETPVLALITAIDDQRKDKDDPGATFVDLVVFPPREPSRALDGVRLYDTAAGGAEAREKGLGHVAHHADVWDDDSKTTTRRATKPKNDGSGDPKPPADAGAGDGSGATPSK